ncbi:MAG TPA: protein-L-isoaspartate(D-aspartate) O-methyltransferase [Thermodesulfobacteriota bacterium]|nr:protein-L-isoaspartate(D-aspartate) O-methyltransferase [Thermodesulfobacteriota bacterium]
METNADYNYTNARTNMVNEQIKARGIKSKKLLTTFLRVPRHLFIPKEYSLYSYSDGPLPIGEDQTISQPYIVALMTDLLDLQKGDKVLEIGTGCGYQTAILSDLGCRVYTIEIIESLGLRAKETLDNLGYENINFKIGDGYQGWKEKSPFDAIIVTACPKVLPKPLVDQLKIGGRMVIPLEEEYQELKLIIKEKSGLTKKRITLVRFVPMTGEAENASYNV